jgi:hypothetical protein
MLTSNPVINQKYMLLGKITKLTLPIAEIISVIIPANKPSAKARNSFSDIIRNNLIPKNIIVANNYKNIKRPNIPISVKIIR